MACLQKNFKVIRLSVHDSLFMIQSFQNPMEKRESVSSASSLNMDNAY